MEDDQVGTGFDPTAGLLGKIPKWI